MHDSLPHWRAARSFQDLCELGARFVEGDPVGFPGWLPGELDDESDAQVELLARAQRAGFLTLASQPGLPPEAGADGRIERRRAFVFGFASAELAARLELAAEGAGLLIRQFAARDSGGKPWPVAERGPEVFLAVGDAQGPAELELFEDALGPGPALEALAATRYLVLVDPTWGQDDRLWPAIAQAID